RPGLHPHRGPQVAGGARRGQLHCLRQQELRHRFAQSGSVTNMNWSRRAWLMAMAASTVTGRAATVKLPGKVRLGLIGYDGHVAEILRPLPDFPDVEL